MRCEGLGEKNFCPYIGHRGKTEAEQNCLCSPLIFVVFLESNLNFLILFLFIFGGCLTASSFF